MTAVCPIDPKHRAFRAHTGEVACLDCNALSKARPKRQNKFNAVKVETRLGRADSKKEGRRLEALYNLALAGQIQDLIPHPVYELKAWSPEGPIVIGKFTPDAEYVERGRKIAEDIKSPATRRLADYRLRKKLFEANHPEIEFRET